jgi:hypothetical protein
LASSIPEIRCRRPSSCGLPAICRQGGTYSGSSAKRPVPSDAGHRQRHVAGAHLVVEQQLEVLGREGQRGAVEPRDLVDHLVLDGHEAGHARRPGIHRSPGGRDGLRGRGALGDGGPVDVRLVRAPGRQHQVHDVCVARRRHAVGQHAGRRRRIIVRDAEGRAVGEDAARVAQRQRPVPQRVVVHRQRGDAVRIREQRAQRERDRLVEVAALRLEVVRREVHPFLPDDAGGKVRRGAHGSGGRRSRKPCD